MAAPISRSLRRARNEHSMPCKEVSVLIYGLFKVIQCCGTKQQLCQACFYQEGWEAEEGGCGEGMKIPHVPC